MSGRRTAHRRTDAEGGLARKVRASTVNAGASVTAAAKSATETGGQQDFKVSHSSGTGVRTRGRQAAAVAAAHRPRQAACIVSTGRFLGATTKSGTQRESSSSVQNPSWGRLYVQGVLTAGQTFPGLLGRLVGSTARVLCRSRQANPKSHCHFSPAPKTTDAHHAAQKMSEPPFFI